MVNYEIINADVIAGLQRLDAGQFDTCITSPPYYGLRNYGAPGQIGLEKTPEEYVEKIVEVFRAVRRVLKDDGTVWLNIGDSYARSMERWGGVDDMSSKQASNVGSKALAGKPEKWEHPVIKQKDLIGIPWAVAFALRADGWYLRQDIIWHKTNPMPESVCDRCTKSHEYIFLLSRYPKYYFDYEAIKEPAKYVCSKIDKRNPKYGECGTGLSPHRGLSKNNYDMANKRSVWSIATNNFKGKHYATFPPDLIRPCILAGSRKGGNVLDPFAGSGTTVYVAVQEGRNATGIELNSEYAELARRTIESNIQQINFCQIM